MSNKLIGILILLSITLLTIPNAAAETHDIGVVAYAIDRSIDFNHPPATISFEVSIFNLGCVTETGISLIVQQGSTGKTLYYNDNEVPELGSWNQKRFILEIPTSEIDPPPAGNRWTSESFHFSAIQDNYYADWETWNNFDYVTMKVKPPRR